MKAIKNNFPQIEICVVVILIDQKRSLSRIRFIITVYFQNFHYDIMFK